MSMKFPMHWFPPSSYLPNFFAYFTRYTDSSRAKVHVLLYNMRHKISQTYKTYSFSSWMNSKELQNNRMRDTNNIIWSIYSWNPHFIVRMFAAYGSRVQFSPNSLFRNILLAWLPLLVNRRVPRFAKSYYWLCNVCQCVCLRLCVFTHQLSSHWKDIHEILYLITFRKSDIFLNIRQI